MDENKINFVKDGIRLKYFGLFPVATSKCSDQSEDGTHTTEEFTSICSRQTESLRGFLWLGLFGHWSGDPEKQIVR